MTINLKKTKEIIFKNIVHSGFYDLCQLILIIIFIPLIITKLGLIEFGLFIYLKIFSGPAGFYTLLDLGLKSFTHIEIAKMNHVKDKKNILTLLFGNVIILTIFASLIVIFCIFFVYDPLINYLNIPDNYLEDFSKCLKIALMFIIIELPFVVVLGVFEGFQKIRDLKKYDLVSNLIFTISTTIGLIFFNNISFKEIFYIFILTNFIKYIYTITKLKKFDINFFSFLNINFKILKNNCNFLIQNILFIKNLYLTNIATNLTNYLEKFFIIIFINDIKIFSIFEVISKFPKIIKIGSAFLSTPVLANISIFSSKKKLFLVKLIYLKILKLNFIFTYTIIIATIFFAEQLLTLWINEETAKNYLLLQVLIGYCFFSPINSIGSTTLFGCKYKTNFVLYNSILTNILRLIIWISTYKLFGIWSIIISYYTNIIPSLTNTYFVRELVKLKIFKIVLDIFKFLITDFIFISLTILIMHFLNINLFTNILLIVTYIFCAIFSKIYSDKNIHKDIKILIKKII